MGSGAIGAQAASTSEFALENSCPVGWRWCQESGRRRYWRVDRGGLSGRTPDDMVPAKRGRPGEAGDLRNASARTGADARSTGTADAGAQEEKGRTNLRLDNQ